jgi:hypothetical protein
MRHKIKKAPPLVFFFFFRQILSFFQAQIQKKYLIFNITKLKRKKEKENLPNNCSQAPY